MRAGRPSRTAEQNAAFRAAESARPPSVRLLNDPYAAPLLPSDLRLLAWLSSVPIVGEGVNWFIDTRWPGARSSIIARTRLIDEWLCQTVGAAVKQVVLLGAGFDSRAWRLPALADARVFEVDHPATSAEKRRRLARLGANFAHVRFVPVDFDQQMPAPGLVQAGFDRPIEESTSCSLTSAMAGVERALPTAAMTTGAACLDELRVVGPSPGFS